MVFVQAQRGLPPCRIRVKQRLVVGLLKPGIE